MTGLPLEVYRIDMNTSERSIRKKECSMELILYATDRSINVNCEVL